MQELTDTFGRVHRDLRISVTDRCNFRCTYCMPAEGMDWLPRDEVLSFEEIERIASLLVDRYGFDSIRLTGGEPTVRAHLPQLVAKLAAWTLTWRSPPMAPRWHWWPRRSPMPGLTASTFRSTPCTPPGSLR